MSQTQTAATATITFTSTHSTGFLYSVLGDLVAEANQARTEVAYQATQVQVDRVRAELAARGAL